MNWLISSLHVSSSGSSWPLRWKRDRSVASSCTFLGGDGGGRGVGEDERVERGRRGVFRVCGRCAWEGEAWAEGLQEALHVPQSCSAQ